MPTVDNMSLRVLHIAIRSVDRSNRNALSIRCVNNMFHEFVDNKTKSYVTFELHYAAVERMSLVTRNVNETLHDETETRPRRFINASRDVRRPRRSGYETET